MQHVRRLPCMWLTWVQSPASHIAGPLSHVKSKSWALLMWPQSIKEAQLGCVNMSGLERSSFPKSME